jgi:hypothetical protein
MTLRREVLAGLTGAAAAFCGSSTKSAQAAAPPFGAGLRAGLPWNSGASLGSIPQIPAYRNRLCDTVTMWNEQESWERIAAISGSWKNVINKPERISVALAMLPKTMPALTTPGVWALAAQGSFDGWYDLYAQKLAASGRQDLIVRVGWEHNHTRAWFSGVDPVNYKLAFQRIVGIIRARNPNVLIEWCNVKKGKQPGSIVDCYPGNNFVDIIGVNYYDCWPALNDQATWDTQYLRLYQNGPWGIGAWLKLAVDNGKLFACSEWGIAVGKSPGATDNPFYIRKMFEFFTANQKYIAYENYFNQKTMHQLAPPDLHPLAAAEYLKWWGRPLA